MQPCAPNEELQAQALSLAFLMAAKASASDAPSGTPGQGIIMPESASCYANSTPQGLQRRWQPDMSGVHRYAFSWLVEGCYCVTGNGL